MQRLVLVSKTRRFYNTPARNKATPTDKKHNKPRQCCLVGLDGFYRIGDDYKAIHSHPELSMQEKRTAGIAADRLRTAGFEVTAGVGRTGVVGLLRNGDGPTVMVRADTGIASSSAPCSNT